MKRLLAVLMILALMAAGTGLAEGERAKIDPEMQAELQKVFAEQRQRNAEAAAVINHESPEERIRYLQELLCGLGLLETITGQYDAATLSAVAQFQERMNKEQNAALPITGIADAQTIALLEKQPINPDMEVEIGDAELEKILREKTGKETGAITVSDLLEIEELELWNAPISDISALQNMANLEYLMMENTQVKDIRIFEEWSRPLAVCLLESDNYELGNIKQNKNIDLIIVQYPMEFNY